jgi:tRNA threonylcarbamoyladenosine biosynthesis protein TsaB
MKLLALETATETCSAALWVDGRVLARYVHAPRLQTELLLPMVDELLAEAGLALGGLDAIAYSRGPGAFTGVRIAAAVAQGLAFGVGLGVIPVSSLQTLAQGVLRQHGASRALAVFDARMDEIYVGAYEQGADGLMQPLTPERLGAAASVPLPEGSFFAAGNGLVYYNIIAARCTLSGHDAGLFPAAEDLAALAVPALKAGQGVAPELALPVYLRDEVWQKLPGKGEGA